MPLSVTATAPESPSGANLRSLDRRRCTCCRMFVRDSFGGMREEYLGGSWAELTRL